MNPDCLTENFLLIRILLHVIITQSFKQMNIKHTNMKKCKICHMKKDMVPAPINYSVEHVRQIANHVKLNFRIIDISLGDKMTWIPIIQTRT